MKLLSTLRKVFVRFEGISTPFQVTATMPRARKRDRCTQSNCNDPLSLHNVVRKIETFAPRELAESWDNVGLLVEPPSTGTVKRILLTNDLSEVVLKEAIDVNAQLIISYHPLIFPSMKTVTTNDWKGRIVGTLLHKQIALYSPHTAWDCVEGGVNDWLAQAFGTNASVEPLKRFDDGGSLKIVNALFQNSDLADQASAAINAAVTCATHSFNQRDGRVWLKIFIDNEYLCLPHLRSAIDVNIALNKKVPSKPNAGLGRRVVLKEDITLEKAVSLVKSHLGLKDVSVAIVPEEKYEATTVKVIAICAGSGGSVLKGVKADLYLTGEMSHHEVLDSVHKGIHVVLTRHSNSERGFLEIAANHHLKSLLPEVEFIVSSKDKDPLETK